MVSLQPNKVVHPDHLTHKESQSPSIREKVLTPKEDQETSTTHQVRFWSIWPNNHTMITSTVTRVNSIHLSKSSKLKCANISLKVVNAHLNNIVNLLMAHLNWDNQMTLFQRILVKLPSELSTLTTKLSHANISWLELNANLVMAAHSTMMKMTEESLLTHFQISQKVSLFLQCQRRWRPTISTREETILTTSLTTTMVLMSLLHSSIQTTNKTRWSKSHLSLIWLPFLVDLEDSTQTSTCKLHQYQLVSTMDITWTSTTWCHHTWCTNSKCRCKCTSNQCQTVNLCLSELKLQDKPLNRLETNLSTQRTVLQTRMVKDMKRRIKTILLKSLEARKEKKLSKRSMSLNKRRTRTRNPQRRSFLTRNQSRWVPLCDHD